MFATSPTEGKAMSYQSILVHACQPELAQARYRLAAAIALAEGTRLTGARRARLAAGAWALPCAWLGAGLGRSTANRA